MPLVSIITTVYNCENYIKFSLDSILKQTFQDYEIIIVNDGSADSTWDVVKRHPLSLLGKTILVDNKENKRIPTRRNEAISLSNGKYIAIHDGDDISLPHRLQKEVDYLENNPGVFCCGSRAIKIDRNGNVGGTLMHPPPDHQGIVDFLLIQKLNPIIDPSTLFRKQDFMDLGQYSLDKSIYTVPDMDLWCRAIISGRKLFNLRDLLIKYRINPKGMTMAHRPEMKEAHFKVLKKFVEDYNNVKKDIAR